MLKLIINFIDRHRGDIYYDAGLDAIVTQYTFFKGRHVINCINGSLSGLNCAYVAYDGYSMENNIMFMIVEHEPQDVWYLFDKKMIDYFRSAPSYFDVDDIPWYKLVYLRFKHCVKHPELYPAFNASYTEYADGSLFRDYYDRTQERFTIWNNE